MNKYTLLIKALLMIALGIFSMSYLMNKHQMINYLYGQLDSLVFYANDLNKATNLMVFIVVYLIYVIFNIDLNQLKDFVYYITCIGG
jgi:hypothetical protein